MKQLVLSIFLCLLSFLATAAIKVSIDPTSISLDEEFKLSLITDEVQNNAGVPDLTVLQKDFKILGTERNVTYSIINGQSQSASQWIILLKAKKEGILTLPAIKIGLEQSDPLTINVTANTTRGNNTSKSQTEDSITTQTNQDAFLTTTVSSKKPYVNQQITYKVALNVSKQLFNAQYQPPVVQDALLIPLGKERQYQQFKNNTNYLVEEQSYAIFPQKSGPLKIKSPVFSAVTYDFDSKNIQLKNKEIQLSVQPIPQAFQGKNWLPAKQIQLSDEYEQSNQTLAQGSTLVRTITIEGIGLPAQLLPNLKFNNTPSFNVYPEKGVESNTVKQGELVSRSSIKVTYLFNQAGKATIPEIRLPWFNTTTGQEEFAILRPKNIEITATASATSKIPVQMKAHAAASYPPISKETTWWPWILTFFFALAWIITLALWLVSSSLTKSDKKNSKQELKKLEEACVANNPSKARDAVLAWASCQWPDASILNLTDLSEIIQDSFFKKQLDILSQVLYKKGNKALWKGNELLTAVYTMKRDKVKLQKKSALPPMNPP